MDVTFEVQKGSLHFMREIDVTGNTTTIDPVVRREVQLVEGQLYSARALDLSNREPRPPSRLLRGGEVRGQADGLSATSSTST